MAIEYANALMEYIKCEEDEHRLRVIGMGMRKMLERELIEINAKLEKYKNSEARFSSRIQYRFHRI
jgi:hypothetical protein